MADAQHTHGMSRAALGAHARAAEHRGRRGGRRRAPAEDASSLIDVGDPRAIHVKATGAFIRLSLSSVSRAGARTL